MTKKKFIFIVDTLTIILLLMQIESLISYIVARFYVLNNYTFFDILAYYDVKGIMYIIYISPFEKILVIMGFAIFSMNFVVVILKLIDFFFSKEKILSGKYRYLIIMNLVLIAWRLVEYDYWWSALMSV